MKIRVSKLREIIKEEVRSGPARRRDFKNRQILFFDYDIADELSQREFERQLRREIRQDLGISEEEAEEIVAKGHTVPKMRSQVDGLAYTISRVGDLNDVDVRIRFEWPRRRKKK